MEWYLLALLSAFFVGCSDIFLKKSLFHSHSLEFLTTAMITLTILLLPFLSLMNFSFSFFSWFLIFSRTLILVFSWFLFVKALKHLEISQAIPLKNLSSVFVLIFAFFFLGERLSLLQLTGILVLIIGTYILEMEHDFFHFLTKLKKLPLKYLFFMISALILGAGSSVISKKVLEEVNTITFIFLSFSLLAVVYFVILSIKYNGYKDIGSTYKNSWLFVLGFAGFMLLNDYFYFSALAIPTAFISLVVPIRRLGGLFSSLVGGKMFHEHNLLLRAIASSIMIFGVLLLIW